MEQRDVGKYIVSRFTLIFMVIHGGRRSYYTGENCSHVKAPKRFVTIYVEIAIRFGCYELDFNENLIETDIYRF